MSRKEKKGAARQGNGGQVEEQVGWRRGWEMRAGLGRSERVHAGSNGSRAAPAVAIKQQVGAIIKTESQPSPWATPGAFRRGKTHPERVSAENPPTWRVTCNVCVGFPALVECFGSMVGFTWVCIRCWLRCWFGDQLLVYLRAVGWNDSLMADESRRRSILRVPPGLNEWLQHGTLRGSSSDFVSPAASLFFSFPADVSIRDDLHLSTSQARCRGLGEWGVRACLHLSLLAFVSEVTRRPSPHDGFNKFVSLQTYWFALVVGLTAADRRRLLNWNPPQSVLATTHWATPGMRMIFLSLLFWLWQPLTHLWSFLIGLFSTVQSPPSTPPPLRGLSGEWSGVRKHVIPWFPFKKPTLMLLNASSRQWAVQVSYKLTK